MEPDFSTHNIYEFRIFDNNNNFIYKGFFNLKAWLKSIENNQIWEYYPENKRIIPKDFFPLKVNFNEIKIDENNVINIPLIENKNINNSNNDFDNKNNILLLLEDIVKSRKEKMIPNSYTSHLFEKGNEKILKKLGEEVIELIIAGNKNNKEEIIYESADIIYHLIVFLVNNNISFNDVLNELAKRMDK